MTFDVLGAPGDRKPSFDGDANGLGIGEISDFWFINLDGLRARDFLFEVLLEIDDIGSSIDSKVPFLANNFVGLLNYWSDGLIAAN